MTYSVCLQCSCTEQTKTLQIYFQLVTLFALSEFLLRQTFGEVCLSVLCLIYFLLLLNLCISDSKHAETKTHTHTNAKYIYTEFVQCKFFMKIQYTGRRRAFSIFLLFVKWLGFECVYKNPN